MQPFLVVVLVALIPLVLSQQPAINFGQATIAICNGTAASLVYMLSVPAWSSIAADFVINVQLSSIFSIRSPNLVTAGLSAGAATWNISADTSSNIKMKELWVPYQPEGTQVYVTVNCPAYLSANVSMLPNIPSGLNPTTVSGLNSSSSSDGMLHWWAVPRSIVSYFSYVWVELCQVPSDESYYGFQFRVVFSGVNVMNDACTVSGSKTYDLYDGSGNLNTLASVTAAAQWSSGPVAYVTVYASGLNGSIPLNYNIYSTLNVPIQYTGGVSGRFTGYATRINNDLIIGGPSGQYYPTNVNVMKLYYLKTGDKSSNLNYQYFASACYLKSQAQSALVPGGLKNGSNDNQMLLSDIGLVKSSGFFKGRDSVVSCTFALTYNDYVVLPNIQDFTHINIPTNYVMFGALIGVSVVAGILVFVLAVFAWKVHSSRKGYNAIHH